MMRRAGGLAASLLLHLVLLLVVAEALRVPVPFLEGLLRPLPSTAPERLVYVQPAGGGGGVPLAEPAEPAAPASLLPPAAPPVAAPRSTPSALPPASVRSEGAPAGVEGGEGRGRGFGRGAAGGPAEGLQPAYSDSRVWDRSEPRRLPPTAAERIDSMITADFGPLRDSLASEAERRRQGDWTFERNGRRYGLDERYVHLGRLTLPTALLGLLPLKAQANPIAVERDRKFSQLSREVREQAHRLHIEADFRDAVRATRERKDRERNERRAQAARAANDAPEH